MFKGRSVIEVMVITFTFVVAISIMGLGFLIIWVEFRNPEADTALIANTLMSLISGILGALLGLIAGKSSTVTGGVNDLHERPDHTKDEV
jgi:hypothetical protein